MLVRITYLSNGVGRLVGGLMVSQSPGVQAHASGGLKQRSIQLAGCRQVASLHRGEMGGAQFGLLKDENRKVSGQTTTYRASHFGMDGFPPMGMPSASDGKVPTAEARKEPEGVIMTFRFIGIQLGKLPAGA
jgi:hypothetical protein